MKRDLSPAHVEHFRKMLDIVGEAIELNRMEIDMKLAENKWPKVGQSMAFLGTTNEVRDRYMPLQPLIAMVSAPSFFSEKDPALVFYLMNTRQMFPYGMAQFASGRRVLSIVEEVILDTSDKRTKYRVTGDLIEGYAPPIVRPLIAHLIHTFPQLSERGEKNRVAALELLAANAPS